MKKRPLTVTILGWYFIIGMSLSILMLPLYFTNSIFSASLSLMGSSRTFVVVSGLINGIAMIIAGAAMLKGRGWGRWIYFVGAPIGNVISVMAMGVKILPFLLLGIVFYIVIVILLTRKPVSDYFSSADDSAPLPEPVADPEPAITPAPVAQTGGSIFRKIVSVLLLFPGGMLLMTWLSLLLFATRRVESLIILSLFLGIASGLFIIPAIFLWGRKRWAIVLGVLLTVIGGCLLMVAFSVLAVSASGMLAAQSPNLNPEIMKLYWLSSLIFGVFAAVIGVMLIFLQKEKDKRAIASALEAGRGSTIVDSTPAL